MLLNEVWHGMNFIHFFCHESLPVESQTVCLVCMTQSIDHNCHGAININVRGGLGSLLPRHDRCAVYFPAFLSFASLTDDYNIVKLLMHCFLHL